MTGMMVSMDDELINAVEHFGAEVVQNMNEIEALRAQVRTLFSLIYAMNNETKGIIITCKNGKLALEYVSNLNIFVTTYKLNGKIKMVNA